MDQIGKKSATTWAALRHRLLDGYDHLVKRLAIQLGSMDLAREAVHETYLKLQRQGPMEPVQNPDGYLFRAAINTARNKQAVENRYLTPEEADDLLALADESPDPAQVVEGQSEFVHLERALAELPERRRRIFEASWAEGVSHQELARQYEVDIRTIQREIERALEHIHRYWRRAGLN